MDKIKLKEVASLVKRAEAIESELATLRAKSTHCKEVLKSLSGKDGKPGAISTACVVIQWNSGCKTSFMVTEKFIESAMKMEIISNKNRTRSLNRKFKKL